MPRFLRRRSNLGLNKDEDPLSKALAPPEDETIEDREARLAKQLEAQKRSDAIDEEINRQRIELKKTPRAVRVLLLGTFFGSPIHYVQPPTLPTTLLA